VVDAADLLHPDVGAQEIAAAESVIDALSDVTNGSWIANVDSESDGWCAELRQHCRGVLGSSFVDVEDSDSHARTRELLGHGRTEA
jgi:hypothetical protein